MSTDTDSISMATIERIMADGELAQVCRLLHADTRCRASSMERATPQESAAVRVLIARFVRTSGRSSGGRSGRIA